MKPLRFLATAFTLSSLAVAWPDSLDGVKVVDHINNLLFLRQDGSASTVVSNTNTQATSAASNTNSVATATNTNTQQTSGGSKVTSTGTKTTSGTGTVKASSNATASTAYDPRLPPGGIQMVTPAAIAGAQYYKVGDFVTFGWNYTSLSVTPSAIDILATCSANQATYTLALNQSTQPTGMVIWDTGSYQSSATVPLLTETYTLLIYDAQSSVSATAQAGYLAPYKQYTFGMYIPQPYTDYANYKCPTCLGSGALSEFERQTMGVMLGVGGLTILSFTWFAGGIFGFF